MIRPNFVLDGTAEDFLLSIASNIKNEVNSFFAGLRKEGSYESFKKLPPFAQRIAFFDEVGSYFLPTYRGAVEGWILYGNWEERVIDEDEDFHNLCYVKKGAADRAKAVVEFESAWVWASYASSMVNNMNSIRTNLIKNNPILTDVNIPLGARKDIFEVALKNNESFQKAQKDFDKLIKEVVSSMISNYLYDIGEVRERKRKYRRITEKA